MGWKIEESLLKMILSAPFVILSTIPILVILGLSGLTSLISSSLSSSLLSLSGEAAPAPPRISSASGQGSYDPGYYHQPHGQYGQYYRSDEGREARAEGG